MSAFEELWCQHKTDETEFNKWVAESIYRGQQAKIENLKLKNNNQYRLIKSNEGEIEDLKSLLQKLVDDDYTTMRPSMAYEIQKAIRGE